MIDLRLGDCLEVLKTLEDNSVDSIVTDPPYHLTSITKRFGKEGSAPAQYGTDGAFARASKGFMGKEWDGGDIAFRTDVWKECYRVLKPGGHLLSFGGSRTYHRMAVAIEDAGFEVRDQIMWIYGSGFPKSHNIGKKLEDWEGWGTALKPAHEPICMARKPLSEKSIAENVLKWGTGGINIDGCRIGSEVRTTPIHSEDVKDDTTMFGLHKTIQHERVETTEGRFPANIMFDEEAGKLLDEQSGVLKSGKMKSTHKRHTDGSPNGIYGKFNPNHPIGETYGDTGGASRYFLNVNGSHFDFFTYIYSICGNILENQMDAGMLNGVIQEVEKCIVNHEQFMCGNKSTEQFQKDMKYTISTLTELMTELKTYNYLQGLNIDFYTQELLKTIKILMEKNIGDASYVENINYLMSLTLELMEHIKVIVNLVPNLNYKNGEKITENIITNTTETTEKNYRFFYCPKVSKKERNAGLEDFEDRPSQLNSGGIGRKTSVEKRLESNGENAPTTKNHHPTVKPIKLMEYLITLVTPKGGVVLEPFMGSGSTGIAAKNLGMSFIGIEREEEYFEIAKQRINGN